MHTTRVNVKRSEIKYLDPDTETVEDFLINGRITVINAKKMVKDTNPTLCSSARKTWSTLSPSTPNHLST